MIDLAVIPMCCPCEYLSKMWIVDYDGDNVGACTNIMGFDINMYVRSDASDND